jgi:hypothetical protein
MDLVSKAKALQTDIARLLRADDIEQLAKKFDDLDSIYRVLSSLTQDVKLVRQNCQTEIISRLKKIRCDIEILDNDQPSASDIQQLQSRDHGTKEVAPGVSLPVVTVATEDFIPDTPLYYIRSTDEFACRINGTLIRGQILDFSNGASSVKCRNGAACNIPSCSWGHPTAVTDDGKPRTVQTWSPGSWLYTDQALQKKNLHMRHIGARSTLCADMAHITRSELVDRARQTAHDLLVQLAVDQSQA